MPLSLTGYVLEPPRVGGSNSPFTLTPNNLISNSGAFSAAYPSNEANPRTEYCVFVLKDTKVPGTGPNLGRSLADAVFCWTKNEVVQRFDYFGRESRFKPLAGAAAINLGNLTPEANLTRLKADVPVTQDLTGYPIRVSVGSVGSGTTFPVTLVTLDSLFGTPAVGNVELSLETGNLNWNPADLTNLAGSQVKYQRQTFYPYSESNGKLGLPSGVLLLNPRPASGQFPLIRVGFGEYLTPIQRATEANFSANPTVGTVEWAVNTGRIKLNSSVTTTVYYDGVVFGFNLVIPVEILGTVNAPGVIVPVPSEECDVFFRVSGKVQFPETQFVDTLTTPGKKGVVQIRRSDGAVRFSDSDKALYGSDVAHAVIPDVLIERGVSLRIFRSPVNANATDPSLKDVTAFYTVTKGSLANPIIGAPTVSLPAIPVDTLPVIVEVSQGTGSFVGTLSRLDVPTPPTGIGYVFDYDKRELVFAQRVQQTVVTPTSPGGVQLPDPLLFQTNFSLELETLPNSGIYAPLVVGEDVLVDYPAGFATFVTTQGELEFSGSRGVISGSTFTESGVNFVSVPAGSHLVVLNGDARGDYLVVSSTASNLVLDVSGVPLESNLVYEIRDSVEVVADRYFYEVPIVDPSTQVEKLKYQGAVTNSPRATVDLSKLSRIRIGSNYATLVYVATDGLFSDPFVIDSGFVEVSQATGHLNFAQSDLVFGFWVAYALTNGVDYLLQDTLGFFQLTDRLLSEDEVVVRYKSSDSVLRDERATFLISKELIDHPVPASTLSFNQEGKEVAPNPPPRVYRGGRPQASNQVSFDIEYTHVTFLSAPTITDALPSGPVIDPSERVYIDYSIYAAVGGENNFTVLVPPVATIKVVIQEGLSAFTLLGDWTSTFVSGAFLLLNKVDVYSLQSSSYSGGVTTINLTIGQAFRDDYSDPDIALSSGSIPDAYFVTEVAARDPIPRGMNRFKLSGDRKYEAGTILLFTDGSFLDYYYVSGSSYDKATDKTDVVILTNTVKQYGAVTLKKSVRPVQLGAPSEFMTDLTVVMDRPVQVYRKLQGQKGEFLEQPMDYTLDASGVLKLTEPLKLTESLGIYYTGFKNILQGLRVRASYVNTIAPTVTNGLLNQVLSMSYTTYQPDSFFWRVETMTNFRGELAESYEAEAKASSPTAGPILENAGGTKLYKQGRESLFFQEGYLNNEDIVARNTLKYYNDVIGYTERVLRGLDGRVVGDQDGPFLFDGSITNPARTSFASVTNQIDDRFKVSPAPYVVTGPPFVSTSIGTYQEVYKPALTSRFYPTTQKRFGAVVAGVNAGDPILDLGVQKLTSVANIVRRSPWAVVTVAALAGAITLTVDDANGSSTLLRPAFTVGMRVAIVSQTGTVLVSDLSSLTLSSVDPTTLGLGALPVNIPVGSTVRLATNDTVYAKTYRLGVDVGVDLERGFLTFLGATSVWAGLSNPPTTPSAGEVLDVDVFYNNALTAPYRFPALDGKSLDDDGNRQFPIRSPRVNSEPTLLATEVLFVQPTTGELRTQAVAPYVGTGSLDATGTVITIFGSWPGVGPRIGDLVDIRTGPNSTPVQYRRVAAFTSNTLTVANAFPVPNDTGFTFTVGICPSVVSGVTDNSSTNQIIDTVGYGSVKVGHTVVFVTGPNAGLRRQVTAVVSSTTLNCEPFPSPFAIGDAYRVVNSLTSFGKIVGSFVQDTVAPNLAAQINVLDDEVADTDSIFDASLTVKTLGLNGQTAGNTLTSTGQLFTTLGIDSATLVFIRTGSNAGFYPIQTVVSNTQLQISGTFPAPASGVVFKVVKPSGVSEDFLSKLLGTVLLADARYLQLNAFYVTLLGSTPVLGDPGAYAVRCLTSDIDTENSSATARIAQLSDAVSDVEEHLASGDRLYDTRYTWIDARINMETGVLPAKSRSVEQREKNLAQAKNQMTKLLSVES